VRAGGDAESLQAALAGLLESGKAVVHEELASMLESKGGAERKCAILAALGKAIVLAARAAVEARLGDPDEKVRSFAAVAVERLGQKESVEPLLERVKKERDTNARKNMARALGRCGGRVAHEQAAKQLVKMMRGDKQNLVKKYSAIAMRDFEGEGAKLVLPALEKEALQVKDRNVRSGVVYALSHIGNPATTVPVLEQLLEDQHDQYAIGFLKGAITMVQSGGGGAGMPEEALRWIFWEDREDPARE
jgi:HEAT repeat protein